MTSVSVCVNVFVGEKVRKQKQKQTVLRTYSDDIRAVVCVWLWAFDKLSENNVQSKLLTYVSVYFYTRRHTLPVTDVMNTLLSLTSQLQQETHVQRCFTACNLLDSRRNKETCNLSL